MELKHNFKIWYYLKMDSHQDNLLSRIDERTNLLMDRLVSMKEEIQEIKGSIEKRYVSQDEFQPIKLLVYGLVAITMTSVMGSVLVLVINQ